MARHPLLEELQWRGLLHQQTDGLNAALSAGMMSGYCGFDPTASSLHVGNLVPVMGLVHFQRHGHRPVFLAGGGTGMIGDPSGKTAERQLLSLDEIAENTRAISRQLEKFVETGGKNGALMENNASWLTKLNAIEFMRDVGKHFSINVMMQKDSVKTRLETGMSYTEFSYMLLQAYDYQQLFDKHNVTVQLGGSDQWGNITAGIDLIRRTRSKEAHALTFPLVTTAAGTKFGKTEAGAVWLDPERTSPYKFYQFWVNTDDRDAGQMIRFFSLLSREEIESLDTSMKERPEARDTQRALARDVTERLHGKAAADAAIEVSTLLFGKGEANALSREAVRLLESEIPVFSVQKTGADSFDIIDAICGGDGALFKSKGEARRALEQGGLYFNGARVSAERAPIDRNTLLHGQFLLVRKGARSYGLVKLAA